MKNKLLFLFPLLACSLVACGNLSFTIGNNTSNSGYQNESGAQVTYEYFEGDELGDLSGYTKTEITMKNINSTVDITKNEDLLNYMSVSDDTEITINDFSLVARNQAGLRVGNTNENRAGKLQLALSNPYRLVQVLAKPYKGMVENIEGVSYYADQKAAVRVNDSKFVKLNSTLDEDNNLTTTTCNYLFSESNELTIFCGPQRVIIEKIILYR